MTSGISLYILQALPVPPLCRAASQFLERAALHLSCNHQGYADLWQDRVGGRQTPLQARSELRAAVDAVVADAYRLDRAQFESLLRGFSHRSNPAAPSLSLAAFDRLQAAGFEGFYRWAE